MKKLIFAFLVIFTMTNIFAQEKGLHLTLGGNVGRTNFSYKLESGMPKPGLGFGAGIGAHYYFTQYLGLSIGMDLSVFNTNSHFEDKKFLFPGMKDIEQDTCDLTVRLRNWTEAQKTYFLDIPLLARFQCKWGRKEMHGFYLGLGIKLQIPVSSSYKKADGKVQVYAYYPKYGLNLGEEGLGVELPWYGYGTNDDIFWKGKNQLKMGCAITGEAGFLIGLSRRVDLTLGMMADYGFANIKKKSEELMSVDKNRTPQDEKVGEIASYNGILNSNKTNMIHPLSLRATIGLKIKIGKLKEENNLDDQTKQLAEVLKSMEGKGRRDTIVVNPVVIPIYIPSDSAGGYRGGRPSRYYDEDYYDDGGARGAEPRRSRGATLPQEAIDDLEESIYFALDKYDLDQEAIVVLDRKVAQMKKYPYVSVSLVGHTCDLGSTLHNDELSRNRATEARFYMISKGVKPSRIEIVPMGKHYPNYPNTTEESRRMNRRVDFKFNP
jgi:outer membrane protein OmpA-like peptidoglycan-associated protein